MSILRSRLVKALVAVAAVVSVTGGQVAHDIRPADAIILPSSFTAATKPVVALAANQAAGNLSISFSGPFIAGDTLLLQVSPPGGNCTSATNYVDFHQPPVITVNAGTVVVGVPTLARSAAACVTNGRNDTVVIPIVNTNVLSVLQTQTLTVSNIIYDLGSTTTIGDITVTFTSPNALLPGLLSGPMSAANATTQTLDATGNVPPVPLVPNAGPQALSPVTVRELKVGALAANRYVCLTINGPAGVRFIPGGPAPSVTGPNVTPGSVAVSNTTVSFLLSAGTTTPATYVFNGLTVATGVALGPVTGLVGSYATRDALTLNCAGLAALAFSPVRLGVVIQRARLSGLDRYATAANAFRAAFPCVDDAVLARGDDFADVLSASYLAGRLGTGTLLTRSDTVESSMVSALQA
ncbi:MAG: cell wall-binding repeat-containing protein, partial [Acidimicrobiales bacterium]